MIKPIVSVCTITYMQEKYIAETIEGVLMQEVDFPIEFIIADDCSPDNTEKIVQHYIDNHPRGYWIKYIKHKKNQGMNPNFVWALNQCKGKYIALCEGDDYWTDPKKLQRQVDFLEENEEYVICFHRVNVQKGKNFILDDYIESRFPDNKSDTATVIDLLKNGNFINTVSVLFRNNTNQKGALEMNYSPVGDYLLFIDIAQNGLIKRLNEKMAVYRRGVGVYSTLNLSEIKKNKLKYQATVLSFLSINKQKEVMINKLFKDIDTFERDILSQHNIALSLSFFSLFKVILIKISRLFK